MRLLQYNKDGDFTLIEFFEGDIPKKYAILSHRWGAEEVTFKDLTDGTSRGKAGYGKIQFCGEQARRDGLQYFWVDTCCIDKSNAVELQEAINSMFRWYRDATKCYVYLPDVSRPRINSAGRSNEDWVLIFRKSEWFRRGWTLQELIAPASVDFFSKEGELLGSKASLERHICEVTSIPAKALRGSPLSDFSVAERLSEGKDKAMDRLREEVDKASKGQKREDFSVTFSLSDVVDIDHFVAREDELSKIHQALSGDGSRRAVVLHGLGGIGKTQLSIAYAKRHKNNYSAILWLNIKDEDSLKQSFVKLSKQISREHPSAIRVSNPEANQNLYEAVESVQSWLSLPNNTRWLMIYDNYDNPKLPGKSDPTAVDIRKFLPKSYQGSIIITTRSAEVRIGQCIQIQKLGNMCDSLEILLNVSRREGLVMDPDAMKLAEELDGLPLALATAGAYLDQTARSFSDYLRLYKESWARLKETSPELSSYEDRTLYSTWQISFDNIKQRNPLSTNLLRLWAYFDNQDLWFELLQHSESDSPEWLRELTKDELGFDGAVRVLSNHGLVEVATSSQESTESKGDSIHGCVHSWTIHALNQKWDYDLARLAVKFVAAHVPGEKDSRPWTMQRRLLQHAARCSHMFSKSLVRDDELADDCHNLGLLYADQGKLVEAERMYQRALQSNEKAWGPEHTSTLDTVNNLGLLYADQGKLVEAERMYQRALQGYEKAWGPEHTSTLDTVNNLGNLYKNQGKLVEAEQSLNTTFNLGLLFEHQADSGTARTMFLKALRGYEQVFGLDHAESETVRNILCALDVTDRPSTNSKRHKLLQKLGLRSRT
ncbi:P-loop containing nucleoside triphosphate hydrolase protein [Leptodontidium sp. 2 PMI_412]|nr:P-loop containing nucleoside triphosphate hydrolase protein [Leptodontidium sp. 2 PMI_412]